MRHGPTTKQPTCEIVDDTFIIHITEVGPCILEHDTEGKFVAYL